MTIYKNYTVNEQGKREILEFLRENHKYSVDDPDYFDSEEMLNAWAKDAEFQLAEGNPARLEIPARNAVSGRTETFTISDAGLDGEEVEIDD